MSLSLSDLLGVKRKVVKVPVPHGEVCIRELSVGELREWFDTKDKQEKVRMLAASLCDEGGAALCSAPYDKSTPGNPSVVEQLSGMPDSVALPIYLAALRLNGLIDEGKAEGGEQDPKPEA